MTDTTPDRPVSPQVLADVQSIVDLATRSLVNRDRTINALVEILQKVDANAHAHGWSEAVSSRLLLLLLDAPGEGPNTAKMLIETLAVAQSRIGDHPADEDRKAEHIGRLQWLINAIQEAT